MKPSKTTKQKVKEAAKKIKKNVERRRHTKEGNIRA